MTTQTAEFLDCKSGCDRVEFNWKQEVEFDLWPRDIGNLRGFGPRRMFFCARCQGRAKKVTISLRKSESEKAGRCDARCLNGKTSCDCLCLGRCHGQNACRCA